MSEPLRFVVAISLLVGAYVFCFHSDQIPGQDRVHARGMEDSVAVAGDSPVHVAPKAASEVLAADSMPRGHYDQAGVASVLGITEDPDRLWWFVRLVLFVLLAIWLIGWAIRQLFRRAQRRPSYDEFDFEADRIDPELEDVYAEPLIQDDDLAEIPGTDAAAKSRLNTAGVYQTQQLGAMSQDQTQSLQDPLHSPNLGLQPSEDKTESPQSAFVNDHLSAVEPTVETAPEKSEFSVAENPAVAPSHAPQEELSVPASHSIEHLAGSGAARLPTPETPQFIASQPAVSQPAVSQPDVSQPDVSQPDVSQPAVSQPEPSPSDPGTLEPAAPETSGPEPSRTGFARPVITAALAAGAVKAVASVRSRLQSDSPVADDSEPGSKETSSGQGGPERQIAPEKSAPDLAETNGNARKEAVQSDSIGGVASSEESADRDDRKDADENASPEPIANSSPGDCSHKSMPVEKADVSSGAATESAGPAPCTEQGRQPLVPAEPQPYPIENGTMAYNEKDLRNTARDVWETSTRIDLDFGEVYINAPADRDDLTQLPGIDHASAAKMNAAGIYKLKQLQSLSPRQKTSFKRRFGIAFGDWERQIASLQSDEHKKPQSSTQSSNTQKPDSGQVVPGASEASYPDVLKRPIGFASANVRAQPQGATGSASQSDETVPAEKFNAEMNQAETNQAETNQAETNQTETNQTETNQAETNQAETNQTETIEAETNQAELHKDRAVGDPAILPRMVVTSMASFAQSRLATGSSGLDARETARVDPELGFLYTTRPETVDDLTRLQGVDSGLAEQMNRAGVYQYRQIHGMTDAQSQRLARKLDLPTATMEQLRRSVSQTEQGREVTTAKPEPVDENGRLNGITLREIIPGVFDGAQLVAFPEQVLFRGDDPGMWRTQTPDMSGPDVRNDINYLRIRRLDTRESVVVPITRTHVFQEAGATPNGWNGSAENFYGGFHLGVFGKSLPKEVETSFGCGGWGFGHAHGQNDRQGWAWAGRAIPRTSFEISVGRIGEVPGTVVFRSDDPNHWNRRVRQSSSQTADPLDTVTHPIHFVRVMRVDSGQAVIVATTQVLEEGEDPRCGWNGTNATFFGGRHLGAYHTDLPSEGETRFGCGGWGFGHRQHHNDSQAWVWDGRSIPKTVFEISVLESVPTAWRHELVDGPD